MNRSSFAFAFVSALAWSRAGAQAPTRPPSVDPQLAEIARSFAAISLGPPPTELNPSRSIALGSKIDATVQEKLSSSPLSDRSVVLDDSFLPVDIQLGAPSDVAAVSKELTDHGSHVTTTFGSHVLAEVPSSQIGTISDLPKVLHFVLQSQFRANQSQGEAAAQVSEGVAMTHVDTLHNLGFIGTGVKIGIIDEDFSGLPALIDKGLVRRPAAIHSFESSKGAKELPHGTACAEIVSAMAPGAELYLAEFDGRPDHLKQAADWLLSQQVQIISLSGGYPTNPTDGSDMVSRYIESHPEVLWVVGAGNDANKHWSGWSYDRNGDGYIDIGEKASPYLVVRPMDAQLDVVVRWNPAVAPNRGTSSPVPDIDAYLVELDQSGRKIIWRSASERPQRTRFDSPFEELHLKGIRDTRRRLALVLRQASSASPVLVHVIVGPEAQLFPRDPSGSIMSPASAPSSLAVGGFDFVQDSLAIYSGQGPTDDGRMKPDLVAPTDVISQTMNVEGRFKGTSAAAPHAAGLAAVLIQRYRPTSVEKLRSLLVQASLPVGSPSPNNAYGHGKMDVAQLKPSRSNVKRKDVVDTAVELPESLGGPVGAAVLDKLRFAPASANSSFKARVAADQATYRIGDPIGISVAASVRAGCSLLHRDSGGAYSVLSAELSVNPDETVAFPPAGKIMKAGEPVGDDELLLICATEALDLGQVDAQSLPPSLAIARTVVRVEP